jgi:predicted SnoaL-like aldol condensation-catalyzing enzyme
MDFEQSGVKGRSARTQKNYFGAAIPAALELPGLASALARVFHQIFNKKPMNKTRIANAITNGTIN